MYWKIGKLNSSALYLMGTLLHTAWVLYDSLSWSILSMKRKFEADKWAFKCHRKVDFLSKRQKRERGRENHFRFDWQERGQNYSRLIWSHFFSSPAPKQGEDDKGRGAILSRLPPPPSLFPSSFVLLFKKFRQAPQMFFQQMSTQSGEGGKTISESISFPPLLSFPPYAQYCTVQT